MLRPKLAFVVGGLAFLACSDQAYRVGSTGGNWTGSGAGGAVGSGGGAGLDSALTGASGGIGGAAATGTADAAWDDGTSASGGSVPDTGSTFKGGNIASAGTGGTASATGGSGGAGGSRMGTGGAGGDGEAGPPACSCGVGDNDVSYVPRLTMSWDCYCRAYRCDILLDSFGADGGAAASVLAITEYADCGLIVVTTKVGPDLPLSHVFDAANGVLVGEQRGTDVPSKCPFGDAGSYGSLSAGQFPAATCKVTSCAPGGSPIASCGSGGIGGSATGGAGGKAGAGGSGGARDAGPPADPYIWVAIQDTEQRACTTVGPGSDIDAVALLSAAGAPLGYGKIATAVFTANPIGNACENADCSGGNCKYATLGKSFPEEILVAYTEGPPDAVVQAIGDDYGYLSLNAGALQIQIGDLNGAGPAQQLRSGDFVQVFEVDKSYISSGSAPASCSCLPEHYTVWLQTTAGKAVALKPAVLAAENMCSALTALSTEGCGTTLFLVP